jgi:hypothetical protein
MKKTPSHFPARANTMHVLNKQKVNTASKKNYISKTQV